MQNRWRILTVVSLLGISSGFFASASAQEVVSLFFDNTGDEAGITPPGTTEFSFLGSSWQGGTVATVLIPSLYASGSFSYHMEAGGGRVTFESPVDSVTFFFVHGFGFAEGTATAFDPKDNQIASATSNTATVFGDPNNFVTLDPAEVISRVEFTGGVIDNFSFTPPAPPPSRIPQGNLSIELEEVASGLRSPVALTHAGDGSGRLFVVDQAGIISVIENREILATPFLDLSAKIVSLSDAFDERGLLGLAFHPNYTENGRFFVRYSAPREGDPNESCNDPGGFIVGCHKEVLAEYRASSDPNVADPSSEIVLFEIDEPEFNHDGGHVAFGPDGLLYFSLGDGGGRDDGLSSMPPAHGSIGHGQNIETALGAMLRIDVDGGPPFRVPPDNPFVGLKGLDEIHAYGFRNPYRFSFDRGGSRELFLADVGQDLTEEIDIVVKGGNYGWAIREGAACFDPSDPTMARANCPTEGLIDPIAQYDHSEGLAVIGGFVYRGSRFPQLIGKYVFGDFSLDFGPTGRLFYLDADGDRSQIFEFRLNEPFGLFVKGFGEDEEGEIYVLASAELAPFGQGGQVFHILGEGRQVPGDCNQDGTVDVSDAICVFGVLFLGQPALFPCGDGSPADPANLGLLDWQPDGIVDLSDGISLLLFLFSGGPAHSMAVPGMETRRCVPVGGCLTSPGCR